MTLAFSPLSIEGPNEEEVTTYSAIVLGLALLAVVAILIALSSKSRVKK